MKQTTLSLLICLFATLVVSFHLGFKKQPDIKQWENILSSQRTSLQWKNKFAPDFEMKLLDGSVFKMSENVGKKVIVLNFFATWCGPCKTEMPEFSRFYLENKNKPFILVGVDTAEKKEDVEALVKELDVKFPVGIDHTGKIINKYGVSGYPTTVFIGANGKVQLYEVGPILNTDVAFKKLMEDNMQTLQTGKGISKQTYLAGVSKETYKGINLRSHTHRHEKALTGRAKTISESMDCPCGCPENKVNECTCSTAQNIRKKLRSMTFAKKTDEQVIKELNKEFCMGEHE